MRALARDLVSGLDADERAALSRLAAAPQGLAVDALEPAMLERLSRRLGNCLKLDPAGPTFGFTTADLAAPFAAALRDAAPPRSNAAAGGATLTAIRALLSAGDEAGALALFRRAGGVFFMHFHGLDACLEAVRAFPQEMREGESALVFALAMHALKSGNVSRARFLIAQRYGAEANDLGLILARPGRFPLDLRLFRFLMAMYEDTAITDAMRTQLFDALGEVPIDDHLQRGSFYNAMLEVFVRRREFDAAGALAQRARHHYGRADAHLLGFYIDLYQAILALMRGVLPEAEVHCRAAAAALRQVPFDTASDARLLGLVQAVLRYERGEVEALVRFLNEEFDKFAYGELWPTVAELAINYGAQALARHVAIPAARLFLDKWRIQEWRSNRFRLIITLREVTILQSGNRWQEAADLLVAVQARINRTWVESAADSLLRLVDPQEIALAMAWLRHLIWEVPSRPMLREQLAELLRNDHLTERQRITALIWSAHVARLQRDVTAARGALVKALEASGRLGTVMPLVEESGLLERLLADKRLGPFALASGEARTIVRRLKATDAPVSERARRAGLTRQEMKVLTLAVEGGTNKYIARSLGLSEVTVKFHLSNVYRKIGCRRRAEAIATARALGWVA